MGDIDRIRHGHASITQEDFQARMEAQCEAIEQYRFRVIREEGRQLSLDDAAREWIERFAEQFSEKHDAV